MPIKKLEVRATFRLIDSCSFQTMVKGRTKITKSMTVFGTAVATSNAFAAVQLVLASCEAQKSLMGSHWKIAMRSEARHQAMTTVCVT